MSVKTIARTVATAEYTMIRRPIDQLNSALIAPRMPLESPVRQGIEQVLSWADLTAGRLLDDDDLTRRGQAARDRLSLLRTADALEAKAQSRAVEAEERAAQARRNAEQQAAQVEDGLSEAVAQARTEELAAKREARERAAREATAKKQQIRRQAESVIERERRVLEAREQGIEADLEEVTAEPAQELRDAQAHQRKARADRADAARLRELGRVEKQARR